MTEIPRLHKWWSRWSMVNQVGGNAQANLCTTFSIGHNKTHNKMRKIISIPIIRIWRTIMSLNNAHASPVIIMRYVRTVCVARRFTKVQNKIKTWGPINKSIINNRKEINICWSRQSLNLSPVKLKISCTCIRMWIWRGTFQRSLLKIKARLKNKECMRLHRRDQN